MCKNLKVIFSDICSQCIILKRTNTTNNNYVYVNSEYVIHDSISEIVSIDSLATINVNSFGLL